ncbi:helix-turn-helix domain-containing protein, partial [Allorhizocola rhizosphaerae]|uniref:helix-turn-helix domain-containing protein n=1 Tax=Allorhizocola rhizosphaerae TaxID=1872709 RepID=UPI0013C36D19
MSNAMSNTSFGLRLAALRRRHGWSQRRLAELLCAASGVPTVSRNEVSRWERGLRTPTGPWLATLSQVLQEPMGGRSAAADPPTERDVPAPARAGHIQA